MEQKESTLTGMYADAYRGIQAMAEKKYITIGDDLKHSIYFAMEKVMSVEDIDKCEKTSIIKAFANMIKNGLDYTKSQCYFFVQNDKTSSTGKSLRFGWQYQGLVKFAKEKLGAKKVCPVLVYEGDEFSAHYELGELIIDRHVPKLNGRGELKAGYCVVHFDAGCIVRYFEKSEIEKRSGYAKSQKFWKEWTREMQEKTLINATLKRIIEQSGETDNEDLYRDDDDDDMKGFRVNKMISNPVDLSVVQTQTDETKSVTKDEKTDETVYEPTEVTEDRTSERAVRKTKIMQL
jgi:recombinational DNA repair protein RecT